VQVRETVEGFDIEKGRMQTLHLAVIRPGAGMIAEGPGQATRR
jgi:hypothetical protein